MRIPKKLEKPKTAKTHEKPQSRDLGFLMFFSNVFCMFIKLSIFSSVALLLLSFSHLLPVALNHVRMLPTLVLFLCLVCARRPLVSSQSPCDVGLCKELSSGCWSVIAHLRPDCRRENMGKCGGEPHTVNPKVSETVVDAIHHCPIRHCVKGFERALLSSSSETMLVLVVTVKAALAPIMADGTATKPLVRVVGTQLVPVPVHPMFVAKISGMRLSEMLPSEMCEVLFPDMLKRFGKLRKVNGLRTPPNMTVSPIGTNSRASLFLRSPCDDVCVGSAFVVYPQSCLFPTRYESTQESA